MHSLALKSTATIMQEKMHTVALVFKMQCTRIVFTALVMFSGYSASPIWEHEATHSAPFYLAEASSFKSRPFYIVKKTTCTALCVFNDPRVKRAFKPQLIMHAIVTFLCKQSSSFH